MKRNTKKENKDGEHMEEYPMDKSEKSRLDLLLKERDELRKLTGNYDKKKEARKMHIIIKLAMYIFGGIFIFLIVLHKKGYF